MLQNDFNLQKALANVSVVIKQQLCKLCAKATFNIVANLEIFIKPVVGRSKKDSYR